jgi:hypothetical protein
MDAHVGTENALASRQATVGGSLGRFLVRESLPIIVCCVLAILGAVLLPQLLSTDGWLALVGGRLIAEHGLPHHDAFTILGHGRAWVDQQWLGQLAFYGLDVLGGVRLLLAANLLLVVGAFTAAVVCARRRGGQPTTVAVVALVALLPFLVTGIFARTQSLAYLPFVAVIALLTSGAGVSWRRVVLILAIIALWSNVHGSVLLAAALVALRGAVDLRESRRLGTIDRRAAALLLGPWLCVLASPYSFHLLSYYAKTAFNPAFSTYLSYWAPTTFSPISLPLLVLLFALVWLLGRTGDTYTTYERWLLVVGAVLGLLAVRNWTFAALLAVMLAPAGLDRALRKRESRDTPWFGGPVAGVVAVATAIGVVAAFAHSDSSLTRDFPRAAGGVAVRSAAAPGAQVYAGIKFADWLLWTYPGLEGKVVFDARYELLTSSEVKRLTLFSAGSGVDVPLGQPTVYVLDPATDEHAIAALRPHVRVVYDTDQVFVAHALAHN